MNPFVVLEKPNSDIWICLDMRQANLVILWEVHTRDIRGKLKFSANLTRGFIKVLNRRAIEFDNRAKNCCLGGSRGMLPRKILKFYSCRDVFSCILKPQTVTFK